MLYTGRCRGYELRAPHTRRLVRVDLFKTGFDCYRLYNDDICLHLKAGGRLTERDPFRQRDLYFFDSAGFSMLQGGPLPCFLKEEQLQRLLVGEYTVLKESEKQFKCGLHKFGLIEVNTFKRKSEFITAF